MIDYLIVFLVCGGLSIVGIICSIYLFRAIAACIVEEEYGIALALIGWTMFFAGLLLLVVFWGVLGK